MSTEASLVPSIADSGVCCQFSILQNQAKNDLIAVLFQTIAAWSIASNSAGLIQLGKTQSHRKLNDTFV